MMHVALNGWFWDSPFSGSGQYTSHLLTALRQVAPDVQLTLVVPDAGPVEAVPDGITVVRVRLPVGGQWGKVWFEQRGYPAVVKRCGATIAHVPYWGPPLQSPARLVVTVHDVIPLSMPVYQGELAARLYTSLVTAGARGAAHLITDSDFSRDELLDRIDGVPPERVTAIPLAAAPEMHPKLNADCDPCIRDKYKLPDSYALYLGSFDVRKNIRALLSAYTYVKSALGDEYPLVLAGKPPAQWATARFPDLPAESDKLGLTDVVHWIGPVAEADKAGVYRMARVAIVPSRYEGFGLGVLEAMACGTPVIAADATSIPEVAGDSAYLVDPMDARTMGGAIIAVLIQDPLHDHLQNQGLARATQYSWLKTAAQTVDVYRQVETLPERR
ncbi:MAG: glycosyltransferase family 4 protein [Aggregatilineales bacterium]